ncbi:hypothetical protein BJX66DRAFT_301804 [Aspergillus keveii]|uniref:Uncharacterized protein n=1 Tax=Aspergillus keveii TaxID=714993 RepID=A0ABR4GA96_9EURO
MPGSDVHEPARATNTSVSLKNAVIGGGLALLASGHFAQAVPITYSDGGPDNNVNVRNADPIAEAAPLVANSAIPEGAYREIHEDVQGEPEYLAEHMNEDSDVPAHPARSPQVRGGRGRGRGRSRGPTRRSFWSRSYHQDMAGAEEDERLRRSPQSGRGCDRGRGGRGRGVRGGPGRGCL